MAQSHGFKKNHIYGLRFPLGHVPWNKGMRKKYYCIDCTTQVSRKSSKRCHPCAGKTRKHTEESKRLISLHNAVQRGQGHYNWKGGVSSERHRLMHQKEYRLWRVAVFTRDNFTCVQCKSKGYIQADHIKPWSLYPELRYAIDNGRTLCLLCHQKTKSYPKQFIKKGVVN